MHRDTHALLQFNLERLDILALFPDNDTGTRTEYRNPRILGGALDDDATDRSVFQTLLQEFADFQVLVQHGREVRVTRVPLRRPVASDRQPESSRMNFLAHRDSLVADRHSDVTGLLFDLVAATFGTRRRSLERCRFVDCDYLDLQLVNVSAVIVFSIGDCGFKNLLDNDRALFGAEGEDI